MIDFEGIYVALTVPFTPDGAINRDAYEEHCRWLCDQGVSGLIPNGSVGEYQALSMEEKSELVSIAGGAASASGKHLVVGASGYGWRDSKVLVEVAADHGAQAVMVLPPNAHHVDEEEVFKHYSSIADVGVPIIMYNNPLDTKVDLTPALVRRLSTLPQVVGLKDFSRDITRVAAVRDLAPSIQVVVGGDDLALEMYFMGARGWIAGFANAFPKAMVQLATLAESGQFDDAMPIYEALLPVFRWDSAHKGVQAIKACQDAVGSVGGDCRPPRLGFSESERKEFTAVVELTLERLDELPAVSATGHKGK